MVQGVKTLHLFLCLTVSRVTITLCSIQLKILYIYRLAVRQFAHTLLGGASGMRLRFFI